MDQCMYQCMYQCIRVPECQTIRASEYPSIRISIYLIANRPATFIVLDPQGDSLEVTRLHGIHDDIPQAWINVEKLIL